MASPDIKTSVEPVSEARRMAALRANLAMVPEALVAIAGTGISILTFAFSAGARLNGASFNELIVPVAIAGGEILLGTGAWALGMINLDREKYLTNPEIPNNQIPDIDTKAPDGTRQIGLFRGPRRRALWMAATGKTK